MYRTCPADQLLGLHTEGWEREGWEREGWERGRGVWRERSVEREECGGRGVEREGWDREGWEREG